MTHSVRKNKTSAAGNGVERRASVRLEIPGASLRYRLRGLFGPKSGEDFCPVENISRGGLKMLCRRPLRPGQKLAIDVVFEEDDARFDWKGQVVWIFPVQNRDFAFAAGISFAPYQDSGDEQAAAVRAVLEKLEKKYLG